MQPLTLGRAENRDQTISFFCGVIKQDGVISTLDGSRQMFEAAFVAPKDVCLRDIVTSCEYPIPDSCQIDLDVLGANVNQYNLEPTLSRLKHHSQVVLPSEGGLNGEAFSLPQVFACGPQDLPRQRLEMQQWQLTGASYQTCRDQERESLGTVRSSSGSV